jgi:hydroxypyruvate reductase
MSAPAGALGALARSIFDDALDACDAERAILKRASASPGVVRIGGTSLDVGEVDDVRVVAIGKAADAMARALTRLLDDARVPDEARRGLVVAHVDGRTEHSWIERLVGEHPVPGEASMAAGRRLLDFVADCDERTVAIFLLSGGGSALAEWPIDDRLTAVDFARLNDALVRSSLSIREINAIRKRISAIKGGRLAIAASPARRLTVVVSDVAPGDAATVASGPTTRDETTLVEAACAIAKLDRSFEGPLGEALATIAKAASGTGDAAPSIRIDPRLDGHALEVVLDCADAAAIAAASARGRCDEVAGLGCVDGPLDEVVAIHLDALDAMLGRAHRGATLAVVSSGEVTLEVTGDGRGGRNQQTVLAALVAAQDRAIGDHEIAFLSAGTDGRDGPTDAAGAVADLEALARADALGLDAGVHLRAFDAYPFFDALGALVRTGPTGTNVRDLRVFVARVMR